MLFRFGRLCLLEFGTLTHVKFIIRYHYLSVLVLVAFMVFLDFFFFLIE